jgi:hypothetical protein
MSYGRMVQTWINRITIEDIRISGDTFIRIRLIQDR